MDPVSNQKPTTTWGDLVQSAAAKPASVQHPPKRIARATVPAAPEPVAQPVAEAVPVPPPVEPVSALPVVEAVRAQELFAQPTTTETEWPHFPAAAYPTASSSRGTSVLKGIAAGAVLAALASGSFWATSQLWDKSPGKDSSASASAGESDTAMPSSQISAPAPVAPPDSRSVDEQKYLKLLEATPPDNVPDPQQRLLIGWDVCSYIDEHNGSTREMILGVRGHLLEKGVSSADGLLITSAAIKSLCPRNESKLLNPGG